VLPYPSYLRVYEPLHALAEAAQARLADDLEANAEAGLTWTVEQQTALSRAVSSGRLTVESEASREGETPGSYVLRRGGHSFYCPTDVPLRSWLSLTALVQDLGGATAHLWFPADALAHADEAFLRWRQAHPSAVPHIRQTTWGIPRTWFVLVVEDEREVYDVSGRTSVRYRARITDARQRLARAEALLRRVIDETELLDELSDLGAWLAAFDDQSWLELDYAGAASLLGEGLASDASARDIHDALASLRRGDFASAGLAYRRFEERWRTVNAFERAN
jgi:hypothetical protein